MKAPRPVVPHPSDPSIALVELTKGKWAIIDAADAEWVGHASWIASLSRGKWYANRRRRSIQLHREVASHAGMDVDGKEVDHVNGNGLDCRRFNLRAATRAQNMQNTPVRRDSSSGVKGVTWNSQRRKWSAEVDCSGKRHYLGRFETIAEAAVVVREARERLHGEFANHGNS